MMTSIAVYLEMFFFLTLSLGKFSIRVNNKGFKTIAVDNIIVLLLLSLNMYLAFSMDLY